jgi:hypothetical protein
MTTTDPQSASTVLPQWFYTVVTSYPRVRVMRVLTPLLRRQPTWWPK